MKKSLFSSKLITSILGIAVLMSYLILRGGTVTAQPAPTLDSLTQVNSSNQLEGENNSRLYDTEGYLLGIGDSVKVEVFNISDYGGEFRVLSGGILNIPVVGPVVVEGLSLQQAASRIEQSLRPFVRRPRVTLSVLEIRPFQIAIAGEVNRPGAYQITSNSDAGDPSSGLPTLTRAIELAGGITQLADIRKIEVKRRTSQLNQLSSRTGSSTSEQYSSQTIPIDLWALLQEGELGEDLRLQDGDRIIIPQATALNADEAAELASASFSPDEISVNVVGEVESPGNVSVPPNTPLNQAILAAGGFNNRAKTGTVSLVRLSQNGTMSQQEFEVDFSQGINAENNPSLQPNDTIIVKRSGLARASDTASTILSPLGALLRILRIF